MCNTKNQFLAPICMALSILAIVATVSAHGNHDKSTESPARPASEVEKEKLRQINLDYVSTVKPIFDKSCFDCHSSATRFPWYSDLPGAKQLIQKDVSEAKTHVDMTNDFPFESHGTPKEDLEAIRDSVRDGSMPPFRYRIMHWGSGLNDEEKARVLDWIEKSLNSLAAGTADSN